MDKLEFNQPALVILTTEFETNIGFQTIEPDSTIHTGIFEEFEQEKYEIVKIKEGSAIFVLKATDNKFYALDASENIFGEISRGSFTLEDDLDFPDDLEIPKKPSIAKPREIVYFNELHTMMYQLVTVKINEAMLKTMLAEPLTNETKQELIQTYYLCRLDQDIEIKNKTYYGAWNASIKDITNSYQYESAILEKLSGNVTKEDLDSNIKLINEQVLSLDDEEISNSLSVQKSFYSALGLQSIRPKIG